MTASIGTWLSQSGPDCAAVNLAAERFDQDQAALRAGLERLHQAVAMMRGADRQAAFARINFVKALLASLRSLLTCLTPQQAKALAVLLKSLTRELVAAAGLAPDDASSAAASVTQIPTELSSDAAAHALRQELADTALQLRQIIRFVNSQLNERQRGAHEVLASALSSLENLSNNSDAAAVTPEPTATVDIHV